MNIHVKLAQAVTQYDRRQEGKPGHNIYALPIYLRRVADIEADINRGAPVREAVKAGFHGPILNACLRGIGEPPLTDDERDALRFTPATYEPVIPESEES